MAPENADAENGGNRRRWNMERNVKNPSRYTGWDVLKPFLIYYILYNAASAALTFGWAMVMRRSSMAAAAGSRYGDTVAEAINAVSMLAAVLPLIPMLRRELILNGECARSVRTGQEKTRPERVQAEKTQTERTQTERACSERPRRGRARTAADVLLTIVMAWSASIGLNIALAYTGLTRASEAYREVERQQYGAAAAVGTVLFVLLAPAAEEIVFRGLVFNRMKRCYSAVPAVIGSSVLFGVCHGNIVQGTYGVCMGILIAYVYWRTERFAYPCLFHASANLAVYGLAWNAALHEAVYTGWGCAACLALAAVCIGWMEKMHAGKQDMSDNYT